MQFDYVKSDFYDQIKEGTPLFVYPNYLFKNSEFPHGNKSKFVTFECNIFSSKLIYGLVSYINYF